MARKVRIKGLNSDSCSSLKLDTIFEDEQASKEKKASKAFVKNKRRRRKVCGRPWRIRIPRLQFRSVFSPLSVLKKLRDAYVRMMLSLESRGGCGYGALVLGNQMVHPAMFPGRIIDDHNEEEELRIASLRAQNIIV
eukprot:Gb_15064 [translate_table: standard]